MTARRAGVAITALAIALVGCASRTVGSSAGPASTSPPPSAEGVGSQPPLAQLSPQVVILSSPRPPAPDTEQGRTAEAAEVANGLLGLVTLPVGAIRVTNAPAPELTAAPESEMTHRMASAHSFYTAPGSIDSVLTFVQTHLPAGFTSNGGGSGGPPPMAYVNIYGEATLAFQAPWLTVTAVQDGELIGVRVDSQVIWLPVRTAAETIPTSVRGATVVESGVGPAPTKTVTLDATKARALAAIVNALPTATDAEHGCPAISSQITATFASTPKVVVTESLCGIWLDAGEGTQLPLRDTGALQSAFNTMLGLPVYFPLSSPEPSGPAADSPASSPSIMHFLCTPPGWSPLTATPEELQEYGYPPRPDAAHDQAWVQAMTAAGPPYTCPVAASSN